MSLSTISNCKYPEMPLLSPTPAMLPPPFFKGRDERTTQFLRSLIQMIKNHSDLISFVPGERGTHGGIKTPGRLIFHDRNRLQIQVLPLYFNHISFASMRRQLSYFSFVRITKGRQASHVTYINEGVVELRDILSLKRKVAGNGNNSTRPVPSTTATVSAAQANNSSRHERYLQESSRAVALAVSSGKAHACRTNNDLETEECSHHPCLDSGTSKSISSSLSQASYKKVPRKTKTEKMPRIKFKLPKRTALRVKKLLYFNTIIPFINLPSPVKCIENYQTRMLHSRKKISESESSGTKKALSTTKNDSSVSQRAVSGSTAEALLALKSGAPC